MARNINYTGRHSGVKRDTTSTPAAKQFGPAIRPDAIDKTRPGKKAERIPKEEPRQKPLRHRVSAFRLSNLQYPDF